jgi:hypothetical protein
MVERDRQDVTDGNAHRVRAPVLPDHADVTANPLDRTAGPRAARHAARSRSIAPAHARLQLDRVCLHWRGIARFVRKHPERLKAL